jgi:hypothetical protein
MLRGPIASRAYGRSIAIATAPIFELPSRGLRQGYRQTIPSRAVAMWNWDFANLWQALRSSADARSEVFASLLGLGRLFVRQVALVQLVIESL